MRKSITIIASLLFCGISTAADNWPSGSAMHSGSLTVSEKERYEIKSDKILEEIYRKLDDSYQMNAVKEQVKALRNYADSACSIVGISSGAGGSWPSTYAARCETGIAYHHYRSLKFSLACIERLEKESFIFSGQKMTCIMQSLNTKFFE